MPDAPYREPGEREKVPDSERRWFTRHGDSVGGPFDPAAILRSVEAGLLRSESLVRAEDDTEWRALGSVDALRPVHADPRIRPHRPIAWSGRMARHPAIPWWRRLSKRLARYARAYSDLWWTEYEDDDDREHWPWER
jgi:hypothetical protein